MYNLGGGIFFYYGEVIEMKDKESIINEIPSSKKNSLVFMSLNIAHGRKNTLQQFLRRKRYIKRNLDEIASLLKRENPDIIALQEADAESIWSGHFDHVKYIAHKAGFDHIMQGGHVKRNFISYGTAILSNITITRPRTFKFYKTIFRMPKGFVICTVKCPKFQNEIDVVSLHLDPFRKAVRMKQIKELVKLLEDDTNPIVIMGDFNCDWKYSESTLHKLVELLDLRIYKPFDESLITFPANGKRYDWILISQELEFVSHKILKDHVSDHLAVFAEIKWR